MITPCFGDGVNSMKIIKGVALLFYLLLIYCPFVLAAEENDAPFGQAKSIDIDYKPQKLLYDLTTADPKAFDNILDRVSLLYKLYDSDLFDSSIVVIIHGDSIPFFAIDNYVKYKERMHRAKSLTLGSSIEFRMCKMAAKVMKYEPKDIHGFVKMIPMADAEIVRLQNEEGYAYMR